VSHRGAAALLEDGEDVLVPQPRDELQCQYGWQLRAHSKFVAVDDERFLGRLARFVELAELACPPGSAS